MKAEDIIEGLNKHIEDRRKTGNILTRGHLVLQRVITPNSTFKAYKSYEAILWFVKCGKKHRVITVKHTAKIIDGQEESIEREINIELCHLIFNWIGSDFYRQVIKGEYNGVPKNNNEEVPN